MLDAKGDITLALAPISLGNPAAAAVSLHTSSARAALFANPSVKTFRAYEKTLRVGRGDTLSDMMTDAGVSSTEAHAALSALKPHYNARQMRIGDIVTVTFQPTRENLEPGDFMAVSIPKGIRRDVIARRAIDGSFTGNIQEKALSTVTQGASGIITSSLYASAAKADVPVPVLVDLIKVFSWDVDFQRDIRKGDTFEIMYESLRDEDGKTVDHGKVLFASLTLRGERNAIYRHTTKDGETSYFNDKGHGARKALLRTPIDGARLSSRFGKRRHPVLGYTKRHTGVDFAAPRGTPIYAAGDGTIDFIGRKGPSGKLIRIRHNASYKTAYAHMNGYAKGMYKGKRVRQGQIVGYVGTTGRSTGPHLHYEIVKDGRKTNPLRVKMPSGRKLKGKELARFQQVRQERRAQFAALPAATTKLAANTQR